MMNINDKIRQFVQNSKVEPKITSRSEPLWESLRKTGTEIWLDTGDLHEAELNWTSEMSALTTNNTILNNEIQKGIYDSLIAEVSDLVKDLPAEDRVKEIAFVLNARHGLRLASRFGGLVSVELHTDTADDINAIVSYGKRYHEICPDQFLVKVPFTPSGLLGARILREAGVKINLTLEFSARQNVLVTMLAKPDYLNIFLSRIGVYLNDNKLSDGTGVGEMAVLSSQKWVNKLSQNNPWPTRLIVASLLDYKQIETLAGADVYTIPPTVANAGRTNLNGKFLSQMNNTFPVNLFPSANGMAVEKFWEVDDKIIELGKQLASRIPLSGEELVERVRNAGCGDLFPDLTTGELNLIAKDGRIPVHTRWETKIRNGEIALDTLLTLAGLSVFAASQNQLDNRIKSIIN
jgi:transaldolase